VILQRELKSDVPGYLAALAYSIVGVIVLAIILLLGWVLARLGSHGAASGGRSSRRAGDDPVGRREAVA